jgi:dTDP-4-amino-4,6-dideoxygalactose transaminase
MKTKKRIEDLAVLGGKPAFKDKLHVGCPNIGEKRRFLDRVNAMLARRWLANNGPYVQEFEQALTRLLGVRDCIAACNGTTALELAIRALDLKGEVILPSFTFIATAHALQWHNITPVFCDIDSSTHCIDPRRVEELITPRTTGIIGVHLWGRPCDVETLSHIANRHHLELIFDAAHAFACSNRERMIGNFGHAEVFSFHATKFFNTFEGGAITTNDEELAEKVRLTRNFGFADYDEVVCLGTNGKMSEVSAAMGLTQLESLNSFIDQNHRNYMQYLDELRDLPGVYVFRDERREKQNYQYVVVEIDEQASPLSRDQLMRTLWAENVLVRRYFYPGCHKMKPYSDLFPEVGERLPETEKLVSRVLVLPTGSSIGPQEITGLCQIIRFALAHGQELRTQLPEQTISQVSAFAR